MKPNLQVTLWPTFDHFKKFATDNRLGGGIRLNSAMMHASELDDDFARKISGSTVPLWFDIKGRQLRVREVIVKPDHLELIINHEVKVKTPCTVLFKAGEDQCRLKEVRNGKHLIFDGGPHYMVHQGESLHIRHPSLVVQGPVFCDYEIDKIKRVVELGFSLFYLSYVEDQRDIDEFREMIGKDAQIRAKIESKNGLEYVAKQWKKETNTSLVAARGDLYVEIDRPHQILEAVKMIVDHDPQATVGSRMLLSLVDQAVPRCADFSDLAWLYDIGYRNFLLCDELCLKGDLLGRAVNAFESFRSTYGSSFQLNLPKSWYESKIDKDEPDCTAGVPQRKEAQDAQNSLHESPGSSGDS